MRSKAFVVLTVVVAACGPALGGEDEPTGEQLLGIGGNSGDGPGAGGVGGTGGTTGGTGGTTGGTGGTTGGTGGSGGIPATCPDGSQGTDVMLRAGITVPLGGAYDTWIGEQSPNANNFGTDPCNVTGNFPFSGGKDRSCLLRWGITYQIPPHKTVLAAWLELTISDASQDSYPVYFLARSWVPASTTWMNAESQTLWSVPGAKGALDRSSVQFTSVPGGTPIGTNKFGAGVSAVQKVQEWVNNPASNFGIIIAHESNADNLRIRSSSYATAAERPGLGIRYCP